MCEKIEIVLDDITSIKVDIIVNAANTSLLGGGGVDGAIHRRGGPEILQDCRKIINRQGGCKVGDAVITTAGRLPAKYVIHTVGPVWNDGKNNEISKLESCYKKSLQLAIENNAESIAFPGISTGIYRFPKNLAATVAIKTITDFLKGDTMLKKVVLVSFDQESYQILTNTLSSFNK